ncbi:hypothetical protein PHJA_001769700 [Phtheirospermum japonicum]|uniref:Uncharacterized protein n=1 Tax=Phtheirospermum japonicum TaxID=374723 RepID=A0A830CAN9_9LAMI|nr:hypothetical protein PHJA_001769700 [Phtheirospermum japonicum]
MADIAMLVAEEYERRVRKSRKSGEEIELLSCVEILALNLKRSSSSSSSWIERTIFTRLGQKGLEPKSQMSLAATNGFFSA